MVNVAAHQVSLREGERGVVVVGAVFHIVVSQLHSRHGVATCSIDREKGVIDLGFIGLATDERFEIVEHNVVVVHHFAAETCQIVGIVGEVLVARVIEDLDGALGILEGFLIVFLIVESGDGARIVLVAHKAEHADILVGILVVGVEFFAT